MLKRLMTVGLAALGLLIAPVAANAAAPDEAVLRDIDGIVEQWRIGANVPGLVYGIVIDGQLAVVRGQGVQELDSKRPVTPDSLFRIASMSKAFTALAILKLADEGKLSLDAPAETYVPEMRGWTYPTGDSRRIRVRDLLNHTAGFVTDDPWGDRQQPLPEAAFTRMLKAGVPFSRPPGMAMEYSNFGYALLGRIISNVSGKRYQDYIRDSVMAPLGMASTGYDVSTSPADRRALGYRWQDAGWVREPDMADGVFGAMGGVETSANDYARWVAFLLSAWPARDGAETGPVSRSTVRGIVEGSNFPSGGMRPTLADGTPCRAARAYGMGWTVISDCELGRALQHGGGYPGYGSNVMLLPDKGIGIFILTNRTYAGPSSAVWKIALTLQQTGAFPDRQPVTSKGVAAGYDIALAVWAAGSVSGSKDGLAMNFLMDRDEAHRAGELARLKAEVGDCPASEPVTAVTAMQGTFTWTCAKGRIEGVLLLAPTPSPALQALDFRVQAP